LNATTQILVQQALNRWLGDQITVQQVTVGSPATGEEEQIVVEIDYVLIETQTKQQIAILVS
jgi:hypothetical protein